MIAYSYERYAEALSVTGRSTLIPLGRVEAQRPAQEGDAGRRPLVGEQLDVGEPRRIVDADVDELPAGAARAPRAAPGGGPVASALVPDPADARMNNVVRFYS